MRIMKKSKLFSLLLIFMSSLSTRSLLASDQPQDFASPIAIEITMEKKVFKVGEPVSGTVRVDNSYPAPVPVIFTIQLFHDGKLISEFSTSVARVPMGPLDFSFKSFGIPRFNDTPSSAGQWRVHIVQKGMDESYAREAVVQIIPKVPSQ